MKWFDCNKEWRMVHYSHREETIMICKDKRGQLYKAWEMLNEIHGSVVVQEN